MASFADSSGWDGAIDRLRHGGYPVRAAPDPLLGLRFDADTVRAFIDSIPGPKILVGHSYGGAVITQAASGDPQVKALVYVAAFAPTRGERLNQLLMRRVAHPIAPLPLVSIKALLDAETLDAVDAYAAAGAHTHAGEPRPADAVDPRAPSRGVTDLSPL